MKDFESRNYGIIVWDGDWRTTDQDTWYVVRKSDYAVTQWYTGVEGREQYDSFSATYKQSRKAFDRYCITACEFYNDDNERVF